LNETDKLFHLSDAFNKVDNIQLTLQHELRSYSGILDDPYKFRPNGTATLLVPTIPQVYFAPGPIVQQLALVYTQNVTVIFRLYSGIPSSENNTATWGNFLEVDHWVAVANNSQLISRFITPNINANKTFYTDNGLEQQERTYQAKFNDSNIWSLVAGNYYPIISTLGITDGVRQLTLLTNQTVGGSSQNSSSIEIMLHRRTVGKHWSLNETQNDTSTAHIATRLILGSRSSLERDRVHISYTHQFAPIPIYGIPTNFTSVAEFISDWRDDFVTTFSPLIDNLPPNLHLVGIKSLGSQSAYDLIRFVHLYEEGQDPSYSKTASVNLGDFFRIAKVNDYYESTLTGTEEISTEEDWVYTFDPIQLRTFVASLQY